MAGSAGQEEGCDGGVEGGNGILGGIQYSPSHAHSSLTGAVAGASCCLPGSRLTLLQSILPTLQLPVES